MYEIRPAETDADIPVPVYGVMASTFWPHIWIQSFVVCPTKTPASEPMSVYFV
jgi:hypothetical protein